MHESDEAVITTRASEVGLALAHPTVRDEAFGIGAPERGKAVDGPGADEDFCARGDALVEDGGWADGFADGDGDGGVEAEDFVADGG